MYIHIGLYYRCIYTHYMEFQLAINRNTLNEIFILSLELIISMVIVGGALMVAINGMSGGPPMP